MKLFDPNDTVMILLDHQTGLLAVAVLIERLRRPPPATPTLRTACATADQRRS